MLRRLRPLPDFVIIGAQKSGTSSLYNFVVQHPAILPAAKKEIRYFALYHGEGEDWYRLHFPIRTSQKLLSGEASPIYLFYPWVPGRMKKLLPDIKLIVILRNPVDRAYSHHNRTKRRKIETLSFEEATNSEEERCAGERERMIKDPDYVPRQHYRRYSYLARGLYADQLENWFSYFDKEKFLILTTEDFRENSQRTLDQVFDFLEVPPFQVEDLRDRHVGNYKPMNEDTRKFLIKYYKPHNERLSKLLQRSFDWDR